MKIIIVGGDFGDIKKESSIINKIGNELKCDIINGGSIDDLKNISLLGYDLILWMPNIDNIEEKIYPIKDIGSVLLCSKNMKINTTEFDAISRIFKMKGNGVISIFKSNNMFDFKLIDALGNVWYNGNVISELTKYILMLYQWTKDSIRVSSININNTTDVIVNSDINKFIELNKSVADKFELISGRYFGNCSTRCSKMFPSMKHDEKILVSKRNVSKNRISVNDLISVHLNETLNVLEYSGISKPSVDAPIQCKIFNTNTHINYIIHGHTYIKNSPYTMKYFPCGDIREYNEIISIIGLNKNGTINLINHGFIIYSDTILNLENIINSLIFIERPVGFELCPYVK